VKLKFLRGEDGEIAVKLKDDIVEKDFNYVEMIQYLYAKNSLEEPEFSEGVSGNEQVKLKEMIVKMNEMVVLDEENAV
jgi:hypothetical protein